MMSKLKIILVTLAFGLVFLTVACDEQSKTTTGNEPNVVAKKNIPARYCKNCQKRK